MPRMPAMKKWNEMINMLGAATHCNTLQHTATHCNTLQHTATHCNTLQHTATHCNSPRHITTHCNMIKWGNKGVGRCNTLQPNKMQNALQHTAQHYNTLKHNEIWKNNNLVNKCVMLQESLDIETHVSHTCLCARVRMHIYVYTYL